MKQNHLILYNVLGFSLAFNACSEGSFSGGSDRGAVVQKPNSGTPGIPTDTTTPNTPNTPPNTGDQTVQNDGGDSQWRPCTRELKVPGRANPYLAGMPAGTTIKYDWAPKADDTKTESPVLLVPDRPDCLKEGESIVFTISGQISHGGSKATDADGKQSDIKWHQKGAIHGKSNIRAPLNSMVAVFLSNEVPTGTPPAKDFQSSASRDYASISPVLGQIFFIGDGKRSDGTLQEVVVPVGAKRLFLGIMDGYEWCNNSGELSGGFSVKKK